MARVKNAVEVVTLTAPGGSKVTVSAASAAKFQRKGYKPVVSAAKPADSKKPIKGEK